MPGLVIVAEYLKHVSHSIACLEQDLQARSESVRWALEIPIFPVGMVNFCLGGSLFKPFGK